MFYVCLPGPAKRLTCLPARVGQSRFLTLYIPTRRGRPRWRLLRKRVTSLPFQALVASSMPAPEFIRPYYTDGYYRLLLLNAFLFVTKGARHLALADPDGRMPRVAQQLLQHTRQLTVYTYAAQVYEPYCRHWLDTLGTQPILTPRLAPLYKAQAIFAPFACGLLPNQSATPVFGVGGYGVCTQNLPLPAPYADALPPEICPFAFAAVLCTLCHEKPLASLVPPTLLLAGRTLDILEVRANNFVVDKGN